MRTRRALTVALAAAAACSRLDGDGAPRPEAIAPAGGYRSQAVQLRISGSSFEPRAVHHLRTGETSVENDFEVRLGAAAFPAQYLGDVEGRDTIETVVPAGLAAGVYDVEIRDSYGRRGVLSGAYRESDREPPHVSASIAPPALVEADAPFVARATLTNTGGESAWLVAAVVNGVALPTGTEIPPGASVDLDVPGLTVAAGSAQLQLQASLRDGVTGLLLEPVAAATAFQALTPPALQVVTSPLPATVSVGQSFSASVQVTNLGQVDAIAVAPSVTPAPGLIADAVAAQDVPAGASRTFTVALHAAAPGDAGARVEMRGLDAVTGDLLPATVGDWAPVTVQLPPSLSVTPPVLPATMTRGQSFNISVAVTNEGEATARSVSGALFVAGGSAPDFTVVAAPAPRDIPGGATETFTWSCAESGSAAGPLSVLATASGTDANSGAEVSSASTASTAIVQDPPALSVAVQVQTALSRGQAFRVTVSVTNSGGATARSVAVGTPQLTATGGAAAQTTSAPAPSDIAGGATASYAFDYVENGASTGTLAFAAAANGADANTGAPASAAGSSPPIPVLVPASLSVTAFSITPSTINRGQSFAVNVTVKNNGQAGAKSVTVGLSQSPTGGVHASTSDTAGFVGLAGGASSTFTWDFVEDGMSAGSLALSASVSGIDACSEASLSAAASGTLVVQEPASLSATLTLPPSVTVGDPFTATMTVTNVGGATANAVHPVSLSVSGTAPASVVSGPSGTTTALTAGSSATFVWTLLATATGTLQLDAAASGADANDGATRPAAASASQPVLPPVESRQLSSDPFAGDGTSFSYLFSYQGMLYVGPNASGTGAVRMAPDGSGAVPVNWQLEVKAGAANTAYQSPNTALCHTIGSLACPINTVQCGPDNEGGRAAFVSGTVNGTEWYMVSGASTASSFSRFIYMTNGTFPLAPGGYDDLAWVQLPQTAQTGGTRGITSTLFAGNALYLGFIADAAGTGGAPILNVLTTMPSLPGLTAVLGTNLTDLIAKNLPAVGQFGSPANTAGWQMVDSMLDVAGSLHVANNGGIARSVGAPAPCASTGCANWMVVTPSNASWTAKASVAPAKNLAGQLERAQRAVPGMILFGGRLFAARNTTAGPQLWSCNPGSSGDLQQCESGEWTLVAPNSVGDTGLTQFNDAGNAAIALLAATGGHLYVGFNNTNGVQIYRTQLPSAAVRADFTGREDCVADQSSCAGLGGNGLGAAVTRLFDGRALAYSGLEWLYLTAGTGASGPKVYRLAP